MILVSFAYLNGSWVPQQHENKGQGQEPVTRPCPYAKTWYSDKLVSVSFRNTTQRTAVPREHPKTDTVIVDFFSLLNFFLCCFFFLKTNSNFYELYFISANHLKKKSLKLQIATLSVWVLPSALKTKGAYVSHFSSGRLVLRIWPNKGT